MTFIICDEPAEAPAPTVSRTAVRGARHLTCRQRRTRVSLLPCISTSPNALDTIHRHTKTLPPVRKLSAIRNKAVIQKVVKLQWMTRAWLASYPAQQHSTPE
jgi:hypothetical protein